MNDKSFAEVVDGLIEMEQAIDDQLRKFGITPTTQINAHKGMSFADACAKTTELQQKAKQLEHVQGQRSPVSHNQHRQQARATYADVPDCDLVEARCEQLRGRMESEKDPGRRYILAKEANDLQAGKLGPREPGYLDTLDANEARIVELQKQAEAEKDVSRRSAIISESVKLQFAKPWEK